jgi:predicted oxidoreductase (fatty acid repression mutant protein)
LKNYLKIYKKNFPGLAKKIFFPNKIKISTNLFSMKIKKKLFFFWDLVKKNMQKIENLKTGAQDWSVQMSQIFGRTN